MTDRIAAALQEYWLAWAEHHGVPTSDELDTRILAALGADAPGGLERQMPLSEAAAYFNRSYAWLLKQCKLPEEEGGFPHRRVNKRYFMTPSDIRAAQGLPANTAVTPAVKRSLRDGLTEGSRRYRDEVASGRRQYRGKGRAVRVR